MPSLRVGSRLRTYKPGLDRVEAWPVELRNSTGWSSRRSSWSSRWLLPSSFAYPVELLPCAKSLHAPHVPYAPECSKRPISKDQTCICLFGEHRHFVALLGTSVPRTVRGCYKWWYQSMVHDHAREQGFLKRFIESKRSRKNYLSIEVMVTLCNVLEVMSDWFVDDEGSWFSTGQEWTVESGSSSSEPSSNSEHWIVVTDLEQQTLTDHDSSSDWDEDVYLMPRDNVQPSTTVNEYGEHMTWPVHYPEEERVVPSTQIIEISSGETTPNSWDRDSPPSVLPHIPMPHVFAPGGGVYPYMPTEENPTDYVYPFITTGVESNDPAIATSSQ
ncbi:unnamed protein product [Microthlaspi erraticum]|uniref:Uncharacterized protein n=1 Tax=Microthlaspi erraticum TaxID=1685480 RepID=A0A6D2KYA5_9BRAS|nr:unnamed protein product [Microthlaspi erraticum]